MLSSSSTFFTICLILPLSLTEMAIELSHQNSAGRSNSSILREMPHFVQIKVFVFFDYVNTLRFKQNQTAIMDYLEIYLQSVNQRYATITNPKIFFKLSGVMAVSTRGAQPFLEQHRLPIGNEGYDVLKVLDSFSLWIYENQRNLPKHTLAHLITAEKMKMKDATGKYGDITISGLGYLRGACVKDDKKRRHYGTALSQDFGAIWDGVFTTAHEFAHNLGVYHDGAGPSVDCPWTDGYLMSYAGWGSKNKFYFSNCSIRSLQEFVRSETCLSSQVDVYQNSAPVLNYAGERLNMTMLCKKYTNNNAAFVDPDRTPGDLCKNLVCRYPDNANGYYVVSVNHPPGDFAPCGGENSFNGKCYNGDCVIWMDMNTVYF